MQSPSLPTKHAGDCVAELPSICASFCCQHRLCMSTDEADNEGAAGAWTGWLHTPEAKQEGMAQQCEGLGFAGSQKAGMLVKLTETTSEKQLPKG